MLLRVGKNPGRNHKSDPANPTALQDVFFRIGGPNVGKADVSLEVNSDNVILDDIWAWRADHGNAGTVGWDINTAKNGVIVNGDNVTATGFFVEHYQQHNVIWNGDGGKVVLFQNELAYDPPSQAAWMQAPGVKGWSALKVADSVTTFNGYGMGSYSFFNQGVDIYADNAFEVPTTLAPGSLHNMLTIFLDPGQGQGWDPERGQWHRRVLDHRQPQHARSPWSTTRKHSLHLAWVASGLSLTRRPRGAPDSIHPIGIDGALKTVGEQSQTTSWAVPS